MEISSVIGLVSVISGFIIAVTSIILNFCLQNKNIIESIRKENRDLLIKSLENFYGPYQQLLATSKELYAKLKFNKPDDWRTLTYLLEGNPLDKNDDYILKEIIRVTDKLEKLSKEQGIFFDDQELRLTISKANSHFRILRSAYNKEIRGDIDRFKDSVYPRELNEKIDKKISQIKTEIDNLRSNTFF